MKNLETFLAVSEGGISGHCAVKRVQSWPFSAKPRVRSFRCTCRRCCRRRDVTLARNILAGALAPAYPFRKDSGKTGWRVTALRSRRAMSKGTATLGEGTEARAAARGAALRRGPATVQRKKITSRRHDAEAPAPSSTPEFLRAFPSVGPSTPDREQRNAVRGHRPRRDAPSRRAEPPLIGRDCADLSHCTPVRTTK